MKYAIHAGHGVKGKGAVGAIAFLDESVEAREITKRVTDYIKANGDEVVNCTEDSGTANQILASIVKKTNASKADYSISIHFNAGAKKTSDKKTTGVEVYCYNTTSKAIPMARRICEKIALLGFKNRGVKYKPTLYVLKRTNMPSILIECCFVDDPEDAKLYNRDTMAKAIAEGILDAVVKPQNASINPVPNSLGEYRVRIKTTALTVRKEPRATSERVAEVTFGNVYTIVDQIGNWGKLKSGAGWISLKYTERC